MILLVWRIIMPIKFSNDKPIFIQLAELIKSEIMSKKYLTGEKLPSVREFAFEFQVNPNTVQKALQLLEDDGLIITDRTNGKFVAENIKLLESHKNKLISQEVDSFIIKMKNFGLNINEIKNLINNKGE
jgi:DNA-binding transcriptional regulator YhcF (GntR family)